MDYLVQMLNIFITCVFSSKAVKQCYEVTTIYIYHFIENTEGLLLHRCYKSSLIFLLFLAKITLTLILPTLLTIWITLTNIFYNMFIYPRIFRLPIKQLVFPIFPFLTSGSVQFWSGSTYQSGWEKNKMF